MKHLAEMPLVWLSVMFLTGITLSGNLNISSPIWLAAGALMAAGLFLEKKAALRLLHRDRILPISPIPLSGLLLALACGGGLYQLSMPSWNSSHLAWYNGRFDVEVVGWVADMPVEADKTASLTIEAQSIRLKSGGVLIPIKGKMMVKAPAAGGFFYGERLLISGNLTAPPGNETFSYREYLARRGIYSWLASPEIIRLEGVAGNRLMSHIYGLRKTIENHIYRMLPSDEAGLLVGVLLGSDKGLPANAREAFRETGTSHILAVSGFNISVLVALMAALFRRWLPRLWSLVPVVVGIMLYSLMVGGQASEVRAAVMGCAAQFGLALGRRPTSGSALIFSAALMSLFNPTILWDIGFQLSFTATLGILLWGEALTGAALRLSERLFPPSISARLAAWTAEFVLITLAAQVFTLPVSVYHFHTFSWVGLMANPLILPAQQLLMMLGGLSALTGLLYFPLGQVLAWLAWPFCAYTLVCARLLADSGDGILETGEVSILFVLLYYFGLWVISSRWRRISLFLRQFAWQAALLLGGVMVLLVWRAYFTSPDGRLYITRLDYSVETVYFIITPGGNRILINGMSKPQQTASLIGGQIFPFQPRLDAIFLTTEKDIYQKGLPVFLSRNVADQILVLPSADSIDLDNGSGEAAIQLQTGQVFSIGDGGTLRVMQIGRGCADLELKYGRMRAWLSQCELPPTAPFESPEWSVISLSQTGLGKEDVVRLSRLRSVLVAARDKDPGILTLPNWVMISLETPVQIVSDGLYLDVSISSP